MIWNGFAIEYDLDESVRGDERGPLVPSGILGIDIEDPNEAAGYLEEHDRPDSEVSAAAAGKVHLNTAAWLERERYADILEDAGQHYADRLEAAADDAAENRAEAMREDGSW